MVDLLGYKLEKAEKVLLNKGIAWEVKLTSPPKQLKFSTEQNEFRIVRQKKLSANNILLTVVREAKREVNINGD